MRKIISLVFFALSFYTSASAQQAIRANRVINHIGEKMVVVDSVYAIMVYNDSTAVLNLGKEGSKTLLKVVLNLNPTSKFDKEYLKGLNQSLLEITGCIILIADQPAIIVTNKENLYFFPQTNNPKWLALSQLENKKE